MTSTSGSLRRSRRPRATGGRCSERAATTSAAVALLSSCLASSSGPTFSSASAAAAAASAPAAHSQAVNSTAEWVVAGPCELDWTDQSCLLSPNWPFDYSASQECEAHLVDGLGKRYLEITTFESEHYVDVLRVGGLNISGPAENALIAQGIEIDGPVKWSSDMSQEAAGWRICARAYPPEMGSWMSMGPCLVDESDPACVMSPHYPENYGNSESCALQVFGGVQKYIDIKFFQTEWGWDELRVNGVAYSGSVSNIWEVQGSMFDSTPLVWHSDISKSEAGWVICARDDPPTSTTTSTTTALPGSWVVMGPCLIDQSEPACITSPEYPENYLDNQECIMYVEGNPARYMQVSMFSTEPGYDVLTVSGLSFSGTGQGLDGLLIDGQVRWTSDSSNTAAGWRLCAGEDPPTTTTFTTTSGALGDWVVVGNCELDPDDKACVSTAGFSEGLPYQANDFCFLSIYGGVPKYLEIQKFDTEPANDILKIGDSPFSGHFNDIYQDTYGLSIDQITWTSDSSIQAGGWKLCARDTLPSSTTTTSTYGAQDSWKNVGPEPLHPSPEPDIILP